MAKLYIALPSNDTGNYTPIYISTSPSNTTSAFSISSKTLMSGSITRSGTTYKVYEVSGTIPTYYTVDNTMDALDYWLHDENNTTNREGPYDYGDITTTVHVWECNECAYSSNFVGYIPDLESGTVIMFFNAYVTYEPSIPTWVLSGNTYNISIPNLSSNNNLWVSTSHSLTSGKTYSISVTSKSEANYDGVIVTSGSHSSAGSSWSTMTGWSDYVCGATGNNVTNTTTFTATSTNRTLYIYFRTDSSTINPSPETGSVTITESSTPTYAWTKSGNTYSISVGDNGQWILQQVSVTVNHTYSISMTVACEQNYDGIYLGTSSHSSGERIDNMMGYSDCIMVATSSTSGSSTTASTTWKATTSTIYLYFYTDSSTLNPNPSTGSVTFTDQGVLPTDITVTLNKNYGSGGTSSVSIANGTSASNYPSISLPSRSGFTFLGYYDAQSGGTQYYTASGAGARTFDKTSNCTFYAHWKPIIYNSYQDGYIYCTYTAEAYTKMKATDTVNVAASAPTAGAGTVTVSVLSPYSSWTFASNKTDLNVPKDTPAGTYEITIAMSVVGNAPSYESSYAETTIEVEVIATSISNTGGVTVSYADTTWLDAEGETVIIQPSLSQSLTWNNGQTSTNTSGTYSYTVVTSKTGFSLSNGSVTAVENPTSMARGRFEVKITGTANGKSGTLTVGFNQYGSTITYGDIEIPSSYSYSYVWFYASGETLSPQNTLTYSQKKYVNGNLSETITSGGTITYKTTGSLPSGFSVASNFSSSGTVTWADRGTTVGAERHAEDYLYVEVSLNSKTATVYCDSCYQEANALTWTTPSFSAPATPQSVAASGGTITLTPAATQQQKYTSGDVVQTVTLTSSNFSYAVATSKTGYSLSSNVVTVTNNTSTSARNGFKVRITATSNSKTATRDITFNQSAGSQAYMNPVITAFTYADFSAAGATKTPTVTYSQEYAWNGVSGSGTTVTSGGTLAFTTTGTLPSGFSTGSNYATTGSVTWAGRGTTVGDARDAKSNLTVTVTLNGKTSSAYTCTSCKQVANVVTALALAVGSSTINYDTTTTATATATYTSGSTLDVSGNSNTTYTTNPTGIVTVTK